MRKYPVCDGCGGEINPNRFDGCEEYFVSNGLTLCAECMRKEIEDLDLQILTEALGIQRIEVE